MKALQHIIVSGSKFQALSPRRLVWGAFNTAFNTFELAPPYQNNDKHVGAREAPAAGLAAAVGLAGDETGDAGEEGIHRHRVPRRACS